MPDSDAAAAPPAVGLRHNLERRNGDRRHRRRFVPDRRRGERRRQRLRTLLLAAATLAAPSHPRTHGKIKLLTPSVSVSMADFTAISPDKAYEDLIQKAAEAYELDPDLIRAVMRTESAFDPTVVSPVGAQGLMQLMPALAEELGVTDPFDPEQNVMAGSKYLRRLLDAHRGSLPLTLASYNAGPGNVARYRGIPPFKETRRYVKKITDLMSEPASD
ncbi:MAG: hypothetical protein A3H96_12805 [Acidobacteria bacterium RIFCSPLOWO2_02_FULL_67_36]|nr:MAG: hypothetical protein A3H96_12805 [Acidobacteria bacterium RIFCSPLOWO2_02_FULL_67_36]OFW23504.1 MAG: hypothetical protein A3G21_06115 [Acidobacteria bacterium RIFCSPLOWO2_12_FULL_66_21]